MGTSIRTVALRLLLAITLVASSVIAAGCSSRRALVVSSDPSEIARQGVYEVYRVLPGCRGGCRHQKNAEPAIPPCDRTHKWVGWVHVREADLGQTWYLHPKHWTPPGEKTPRERYALRRICHDDDLGLKVLAHIKRHATDNHFKRWSHACQRRRGWGDFVKGRPKRSRTPIFGEDGPDVDETVNSPLSGYGEGAFVVIDTTKSDAVVAVGIRAAVLGPFELWRKPDCYASISEFVRYPRFRIKRIATVDDIRLSESMDRAGVDKAIDNWLREAEVNLSAEAQRANWVWKKGLQVNRGLFALVHPTGIVGWIWHESDGPEHPEHWALLPTFPTPADVQLNSEVEYVWLSFAPDEMGDPNGSSEVNIQRFFDYTDGLSAQPMTYWELTP